MAYRGKYRPKSPNKYNGDPTNIVYRSSWELRLMNWLDSNHNVIKWSSEEVVVPYKHPITGRWHRYFPDFMAVMKDKNGTNKTYMIEVKPKKQVDPPEKKTKITKRYLQEVQTYAINSYKWKYAKEYCKDRNWIFIVITEKELGLA
jgi:hypothetical protein